MTIIHKPSLYAVENAFQPAREITDAARFAGRIKAVSDAYLGLMAEGANLAIVGNRGIGKTSLARQVQLLGQGDNDLLKKLDVPHDKKFDFLTVYHACGSSTSDIDALLTALLTSKQCLGDWIYDIPKTRKMADSLAPKIGAKIFGIGGEVATQHSSEEVSEAAISAHSVDAIFTNVVNDLVSEGLAKDGLLIIVDEFDQIVTPNGFAPFLKALATNAPRVKFCIVGVATDIQSLMKEHESADRLFAGSIISLEPMSNPELDDIIAIAEHEIGNSIKFSLGARERLVSLAQGHPYMVHLVGKYALRHAYVANRSLIETGEIDETLRSIAASNADPVLEGRYRRAVGASSQREIVLKALAQTQDDQSEVLTTNAYKLALERGVDNSSQYVGQLVTEEYGAEIEKIRERYYRFKDSLFAAYVEAHPQIMRSIETSLQ